MSGTVSPESSPTRASQTASGAAGPAVPVFHGKGFPFVVSGPSGVGKTSVYKTLFDREDVVFSVSATTRPRRNGEEHGREYWFYDEAEFRRMLAAGEFVEHAEVHGKLYGTPREPLDRWIAQGKTVVLDVDVQGGLSLRAAYPGGVFVFILPPSMEELRRRLEGRGSDSSEVVARRLANAPGEIAHYTKYDYAVVNDDLRKAQLEVAAILTAERRRLLRLTAEKGPM